ncbi:TIGR03619 family F420-dependent LLM class oxidoreductase [Streptomyces sp. NPDC055189]
MSSDRPCSPVISSLPRSRQSSARARWHTHIPASGQVPAISGRPLPEYCRRLLDPFTSLAAAATVTAALRIGTGVCLAAQHDPISLAKAAATLDHLSRGRFTLGIGFGWNREEVADHGVEFGRRRAVVWEYIAAMRTLWGQEPAGFQGEFVSFGPFYPWPKPENASVPVLIGANAHLSVFRRIAECADGWMPIGGRGLAAHLPALQQAFADAGRDASALRVVPSGTLPNRGKLDHYRRLGVTEVLCQLPSGSADETLRVLDDFVPYIA